jgi:putative ABC transport system permease protein
VEQVLQAAARRPALCCDSRHGVCPRLSGSVKLVELVPDSEQILIHANSGAKQMIETLARDLRFGLRSLRKSPGFAAICIATLALGIGSAMAMFSLVETVLNDAPQISGSSQLVNLWTVNFANGVDRGLVSPADFMDWKSESTAFQELGAFSERERLLTGAGEPRRILGQTVSFDLLHILGARTELGRTFGADDAQPGAPPAAVISHGLWQTQFAGSREIAGRKIELDGASYQVVGVLSADFWYPRRGTQVWTTLARQSSADRATRSLRVVGRLRPGATVEVAQQEMSRIARSLAVRFPVTDGNMSIRLETIANEQRKKTALVVSFAMGPVVVLLLIACINVTNLLLARGFSRQVEFATRAALGASRWKLLRQQFTENLWLALGGVGLGTALAYSGISLLRNVFAAANPTLAGNIHLSGRGLLFGFVITAVLPLLFGIIPALRTVRESPGEMLKQAGTGGAARITLKRLPLPVLEIAMATVLLLLNILFTRSMIHVEQAAAPGIETNQIFTLTMPAGQTPNVEELTTLLRETPGVSSAAAMEQFPLLVSRRELQPLWIEQGDSKRQQPAIVVRGDQHMLQVLGLQILEGQGFGALESSGAVVSETFAHSYGQELGRATLQKPGESPYVVTGVVRDWLRDARSGETLPTVYLPLRSAQAQSLQIVVRSQAGNGVIPKLASTVSSWDPSQTAPKWQTLAGDIEEELAGSKRIIGAVGAFALLALLLSCAGVYSVMNYSITRRTREMGIRMALGATRGRLFVHVLREAFLLTIAGLLVGWLLGVAAALVVAHELVGVSPVDFWTACGAFLAIMASCGVASFLPARRASRVDPMIAVRFE